MRFLNGPIVAGKWKPGLVFLLLAICRLLVAQSKPTDSYPYFAFARSAEVPSSRFVGRIGVRTETLLHDTRVNQYEVDLRSGMFVLRQTDFFIPDAMPVVLTRTYRPWDENARAFGKGMNHPYDIFPSGSRWPYTYIDLFLEDGSAIHYPRISNGRGFADAVYEHSETSGLFYRSQIKWNGNGWDLRFADGALYKFPEAYNARNSMQAAVIAMQDARGNTIAITRDAARNLLELKSKNRRNVTFKYDGQNRIIEAHDDNGHSMTYTYYVIGWMASVRDEKSHGYDFRYDKDMMTSVQDERDRELVHVTYQDDRVASISASKANTYRFFYVANAGNEVIQTTVQMPSGNKRTFRFKHGILSN